MLFKPTLSQLGFCTGNVDLDACLWNQGVVQIFHHKYSYKQLNDAFNNLVFNNDSLRIKFNYVEKIPDMQLIKHEYIYYPHIVLSSVEEVEQAAKRFLNDPIKDDGALVKCIIFETPDASGIMISGHHIVVDGYSVVVMTNQINEYLQRHEDAGVPKQSYVEYINNEAEYRNSKKYLRDYNYWEQRFNDAPLVSLFADKQNKYDYSSCEVNKNISDSLFRKIKKICTKHSVSVQSFFNALYGIYFYRSKKSNKFTIGVPVLNRTTLAELNTIGLYMHIVPMVMDVEDSTFISNAYKVENSQVDIFRHHKFTQYEIKQMLKKNGINSEQLFDIVADYQEFNDDLSYEIKLPYSNFLSLPIEIHMQSFGKERHNLKIRYRTAMFKENEIQVMANSIISIAEQVVENPHKKICDLEMLSADEKQKVLYTFNDTEVDYPKDKCIHELFEEQAERTPDKTAIVACDRTLTYKELNEEANRIANSLTAKGIGTGDIVGITLPRKSFIISAMLGVLKTGAAYLPIDPENPEERIKHILSDSAAKYSITEDNIYALLESESEENPENVASVDDYCYCIYTSGSTGKPKGTLITHKNVVNYVSANEKNVCHGIIDKETQSILSVTTISFDIFVTEAILPLVNGMKIVFADEEQSRRQTKLVELLKAHPAEIIQTTPTKMRAFMSDKQRLDYLKLFRKIILGGEKLDKTIVKELQKYTDAEIYNIYGPTETTVWISYAKIEDPEDITIGKPTANTQIYITDKYLKPVPIGVTGELCIAGDNVGQGYLNNKELTDEKFVDNPFGNGKLYKTGDLAYWRADGNIVFVGRKDSQVKIRGQRVELEEIENIICDVDGVLQCAVTVREDREARQYICAFYTGEEKSAREIRKAIGEKLPKYMIPHVFSYVSEMPLTSSGKINRKALPEINLESIASETEYKAAATKEEKLLVECIAFVLGIEKISVLDNFFDIGGDSLKTIELVAKLEEKGYTIPVKTVFSCQDICELAQKLEEKHSEEETVEYEHILPATAAQMRVYSAQMMETDSVLYNINYAFKTENVDKKRLEKAVNILIDRHESLRMHFETIEGQVCLVIEDKASVVVEDIAEEEINKFSKPFDLKKAPLVRVGCNQDTVIISLHHIIADGESLPVFFNELNELYMGREIAVKAVQYGEFAAKDGYTQENEKYWLNEFDEEISRLNLPTDYLRKAKQSFRGRTVYEQISKQLQKKIEEKSKEKGITPYVYYMACFSVLLSKLSGNEDVIIGTPFSGRSSRYLNTVGMFANTVALRIRPEGEKKLAELLVEIKDKSIEAMDNQSYPFGELVKRLGAVATDRNPVYDVMFAYQSYAMTDIVFSDEKAEIIPLYAKTAKCDLTFAVLPREYDVVLSVEYATDLFEEEKINLFVGMYIKLLEACLDYPGKIKDISLAETEVIDTFNDTQHTYEISEGATLYSLFEKTAQLNRKKICIRTADKNISFEGLKEFSERLDTEIRNITKGKKSVIAVIAERSIEMYGAIYGIIRGGNAYLPIDPDYPEDRIKYILENSKAAAVVTQSKFNNLLCDAPCIDATKVLDNIGASAVNAPSCAAASEDTAYVIYTSGSTGTPKGAKVSHKAAINRILWMHDKYSLEENDVILQKTPYTFDVSVWEHFWWGICSGSLAASKPDEHFLPAKILDEVEKNKVTHIHFVPSVFELFLNYLETHKEEIPKFNSIRYVFLSGEALSANLIQRFYNMYYYRKVTLHNLYGPTECAVDVTYYDCMPDDIDPVPIGKPIYNTEIYITDKYLKPVPIGVTGELCIAGDNVGQGYLNNKELTDEKFVDNPFGNGKLYKTGDLAYWRADGNIVFVGRKDSQVKINGQRIEIGEIEATVNGVSGVSSVAVIVKSINSKDALVAFYTGEKDLEEEIKAACSSKLPRYMIPAIIERLESIPLNKSGKLDRRALSEYEITFVQTKEDENPVNDAEIFICNAFKSILGLENVGRNSDFFDLGGSSLSMISLLSEEGFEHISATEFMKNPTPKQLALLSQEKMKADYKYLEPLYVCEESDKAIVLLPFAGGGAEVYSNFVNTLKRHKKASIYFIGFLHSARQCEEAAKEIVLFLKNKEIIIYSHCVGSSVALNIINVLEKSNIRISHFFAAASIPPARPTAKNFWKHVPDEMLKKVLVAAGARLNELSKEQAKEFLKRFRKDTDFANVSYFDFCGKIKTPISVILNKKDIFTFNYKKARSLWNNYAEDIRNVCFINSNSHYFQTENSEELIKIITDLLD